jgi:tetratricopeptide (TPR) repeat protein
MREHLIQLRQTLTDRFNEGELRTLCFDLSVDYDSLPGEDKASKARELVAYLQRRDRIRELLETGKRLRPDIPWEDALVEWAQAWLDADMDRLRARRDQADKARREMRERQRVVNLRPLDVTHNFKDRLREMQALCAHLADSTVRLVSVIGRAGIGKTALVSRVLADLEQGNLPATQASHAVGGGVTARPADSILYLSARSTGLGLERIYADVRRMLGEPASGRLAARWADRDTSLAAKVEYLLETMQGGLYLILLDNLEDYLAEDGTIAEDGLRLFVERCLTQPSGVRLIVTSREEVKITAAALHGARSIPLREGLPEDDAVALLHDLDPQGGLGLRDAPEDDLRRAARLTRGIPRALEILAGILHQDPTASLLRLLADEELFGEQVMEELVAAGHRRLGEDERHVMEALAVFDRPAAETAITYLLHPWFPGLDVRPCLHRLISSYFARANRITAEYSLHPLDRDHAYRQLPEDEGPGAYSRRHLELRASDFYANIRKPESEWKSIDDLAPQLAEFEHRVRAEDYDGACWVLEPIDFDYLYLWGNYTRLVGLREKLRGKLMDSVSPAANMNSLGRAYRALGQVERAVICYEQALTIAREVGDRRGEGEALGSLGIALRGSEQAERVIELHEEAIASAREIGDRRIEGIWLGHLGIDHRNLGQVERAIELYEEALAIAREIGDRRNEGVSLGSLGIAYHSLGQIERAINLHEKALAVAQEIGDRRAEQARLGSLGYSYLALGRDERAIGYYEQALAIVRGIGDRRNAGVWLGNLGRAFCALGEVKRAVEYFEHALVIAHEIGDRRWESYHLLGLGRAMLAARALLEAQQCCGQALALEMQETSYQAALALGIVLLQQCDFNSGEVFANAAVRCRAMLDKTESLYEPRYALAAALVGQAVCDPRWAEEDERPGLLAPALAEYRRALENCSAPGVVHDALWNLEMIRAAGIEGLEPVLELLDGALETRRKENRRLDRDH